jgi:hypothetical protein
MWRGERRPPTKAVNRLAQSTWRWSDGPSPSMKRSPAVNRSNFSLSGSAQVSSWPRGLMEGSSSAHLSMAFSIGKDKVRLEAAPAAQFV